MSPTDNGTRADTAEQKRAWFEWFERQKADYFWCLGQLDLCERHAGQVVILHNRLVLGSGPGSSEALEDARQQASAKGRNLPAGHELLFVPIPAQLWVEEPMLPPHRPPEGPRPAPASGEEVQRG